MCHAGTPPSRVPDASARAAVSGPPAHPARLKRTQKLVLYSRITPEGATALHSPHGPRPNPTERRVSTVPSRTCVPRTATHWVTLGPPAL
eukprot:5474101-Prymnesium_polylepis.1